MSNWAVGGILIIAGLASIVFNKGAARIAIAFQRLMTDKEYDEVPFRLGYVLFGASLFATGLLMTLGYIK